MRIDRYTPPQSSFLSMEKDLSIITGNMEKCSRLKRLLCNTTYDPLGQPDPDISVAEMADKGIIRILPKMYVDSEALNYIFINFDNFMPNASNNLFRNNTIEFSIICHYGQWEIKDNQLRPYRIAGEIDSMFNNKYLSGIGTMQFLGARKVLLSDEFGGLTLLYAAIHGEEDKNGYTPIESDRAHYENMMKSLKDLAEE